MSGLDLSGLNDGQRSIVTTLDEPLFVEAGAGSGKTFTLTQRIAWALSEGSGPDGRPFLDDLSQVLVITFTRAAAREIRERVRSSLRALGLREAALSVDSAWISTIHGMCSRILKRHALDLGLDPGFSMASTNAADELRRRALWDVVGEAHRGTNECAALAAAFDQFDFGVQGPRGDSGVLGMVDDIMQAARRCGYDALTVPPAADVDELMGSLRASYGTLVADGLTDKARAVIGPSLEALDAFARLPPGRRTAEEARRVLERVSIPKGRPTCIKEALSAARADLARARLELALMDMRPVAKELIGLARAADERYAQAKREASLLDDDDLVTLALRAVTSSPEVARDYEGRFHLVMVDEFQDTDAQQLELITMLAGKGARHLATVGDAQQSIYRFRGADVSVFRGRGEALPSREHIRLSTNYRSHADVLSFVDRVCGGARGLLGGFMHLDADPGRPDGYRCPDIPRVSIEIASGTAPLADRRRVLALGIADRLARYRQAGERPGDMALLLGTTSHAELYIDAIRARGLECIVTGGSTFTDAPEVRVVAALLHALANPRDTQTGLFPLLSSEMFELDANDFVQLGTRPQAVLDAPTKRPIDIGLRDMVFFHGDRPSRRLSRAHEVLCEACRLLSALPVADVCLRVIRGSGWLSRLEREGAAGRSREANVLAAVRYVRELTEDLGLGPARAALEFDRWLALAKVPPASLSGGETTAVRVMTIHASKGLEFPIVAVAECWDNPRMRSRVMMDGPGDAGTCPVVLMPKGMPRQSAASACDDPRTLGEWFSCLRGRSRDEEEAERTRLLYVALTRAREALIVGVYCNVTKRGLAPTLAGGLLDALYGGALPGVGRSSLDFGGKAAASVRRVEVTKATGGPVVDSAGTLSLPEGGMSGTACSANDVPEARAFTFFGVEPDAALPATTLWTPREGVFSYSSAHALMDDGAPAPSVRAGRAAQDEGAPAPDDADKATNLGSAFHELAQSLVECGADVPCAERVAASKRLWHLSERAGARLDAALARWCASSLRREVRRHGLVRAEVPFFLAVDSSFGDYVEGAIDLLATDPDAPDALVVDYKTGDRALTLAEIEARHRMQANFYAYVLMQCGMERVTCAFCCVELDAGELGGTPGEPVVVRYAFDGKHQPRIGQTGG